MHAGRDDHRNEGFVVDDSDAVIDPHAMVVEVFHAASSPSPYRSQDRQCLDFSLT